jgi:hypothetical protein
MAGPYDRNRDDQGRFDDRPRRGEDRRDREYYGREQEPPRDDRGRFMSEGERGPYYGGADYDDYGDRNYGERYERETERQFGNYRDSYDEDQRLGGRNEPRDQDYFRGSQHGYDPQRGRGRGSMEWREQDYDDRRGQGQGRGRYADPNDRGPEPRDRWQGSGGSRWDQNDYRGRQEDRGGQRDTGRERDEHGRFTRDEADDQRSRGWFGDHRGHSQAARLGWRHRGH